MYTGQPKPSLRTPQRAWLCSLAVLVGLAAVATAAAPGMITLRRGDTLTALAAHYGTTVAQLRDTNALAASDLIYAGAQLRLPPAPAAAPPATAAPAPAAHLPVGAPAPPVPAVVPAVVTASAAAHRARLAMVPQPGTAAVRQLVLSAARTFGVDASLALAVAYQESGFQQRVVSPVDAIGAMQVLPGNTARLSVSAGRRLDLLNAADNVTAGVVLLRDLRRATGADDKTLAAYYQGLGSIARQGVLPVTVQYVASVTALRPRFAS